MATPITEPRPEKLRHLFRCSMFPFPSSQNRRAQNYRSCCTRFESQGAQPLVDNRPTPSFFAKGGQYQSTYQTSIQGLLLSTNARGGLLCWLPENPRVAPRAKSPQRLCQSRHGVALPRSSLPLSADHIEIWTCKVVSRWVGSLLVFMVAVRLRSALGRVA